MSSKIELKALKWAYLKIQFFQLPHYHLIKRHQRYTSVVSSSHSDREGVVSFFRHAMKLPEKSKRLLLILYKVDVLLERASPPFPLTINTTCITSCLSSILLTLYLSQILLIYFLVQWFRLRIQKYWKILICFKRMSNYEKISKGRFLTSWASSSI